MIREVQLVEVCPLHFCSLCRLLLLVLTRRCTSNSKPARQAGRYRTLNAKLYTNPSVNTIPHTPGGSVAAMQASLDLLEASHAALQWAKPDTVHGWCGGPSAAPTENC